MTMTKYRVARQGLKWAVFDAGNIFVQEFKTRDEARIFAGQKPSHAKTPHRATPSKQQDDDARTGG